MKKNFILTEQQKNDPKYMIEIITHDIKNMYELSDSLKANPEFMLSLINLTMRYFVNSTARVTRLQIFYENLSDDLKHNVDFLLKAIDEIIANDTTKTSSDSLCAIFLKSVIDPTFLIGNKQFWQVIEDRNLMRAEYKYYANPEVSILSDKEKERLEKIKDLYKSYLYHLNKQHVETAEKNRILLLRSLRPSYRNNPEFMLELIKIDPDFTQLLTDTLKANHLFIALARMKNPDVSKYLAFSKARDSVETVYERRKKALEEVSNINESNFKEYLTLAERSDKDFMLELIKHNPIIYKFTLKSLRETKKFRKEAIAANPDVKQYVEEEEKLEQKARDEKARKRKLLNEILTEQEELKRKEALKREYQMLGENHPRLVLVNRFINSKKSKALFVKGNNITEEDLESAINEVTEIYPELKSKIDARNKQSSAVYLNKFENVINGLISGELSIKEYASDKGTRIKLRKILSDKSIKLEKLNSIRAMVVNAIANGDLSAMDYIRIFSPNDSISFSNTIIAIKDFLRVTGRILPELVGPNKPINLANRRMYELKKYERPYKVSDFLGSKRGFVNPVTKKMEMVVITQEHLDYAKKYLFIEDEYICATTMGEALNKLIKGDITREEIDERYNSISQLSKKKKEKEEKSSELDTINSEIDKQDDKVANIQGLMQENGVQLPLENGIVK